MATYYVRTDGNDLNAGTGPATNQAWQTVGKALGATGIGVGDTLYIAPGVYRESVVAAFANPANEGQRITISGDPTASQFTGVSAGPVIITNYVNLYSTTGLATLGISKSYITLQNVHITGYTTGGSGIYGSIFAISGTSNIVTSCGFYTPVNSVDINAALIFGLIQGTTGFTVTKCVFMAPVRIGDGSATTSAWNSLSSFKDCIFQNPGQYTPTACLILYSPAGAHVGGATIQNCRFIGNTGVAPYPGNNMSTTYPIVVRNCIFETSTGITSTTNNGQIVESYNIFNCGTARTNVGTGTGSSTRAFISPDYNLSRITGWGNFPFWGNHSSSASQNAGTSTGAPATDIYGVTWLAPSTPTIGAIEYFNNSSTGSYIPTERNASTITIAPGSTSQSIELYLGATGLTASTAGLSARYNRTRTASVSIPLVARTIAQAWTSGGFAEVDATNMPGVYRLDIPDDALAAGADDVTIVVRGASGTNGAVMTIKLSSGGLTSAQTASAVWGADVAGYVAETNFGGVVNATRNVSGSTEIIAQDIPSNVWEELTTNHTTHNTFGWNILRADAQSKQGLVTLASSGGTNRVDADIHAIVNDTAAAAELKGALLHTGGDYITADLQTPITSTVSPAVGPFTVLPSGAGADNIVDLNVGSALPLVLNLQDGAGAPFNASGATITATVYTAGGSTVTTYTGSIIAGYIGAISVPLSTAVTATSATYTMLVSVVIGTTTTVFGPLKLVVRAI